MTRTDATRIFCVTPADALAEPAGLVADADADGVLLDMLLSIVPVTSTRLPMFVVSSDCAEPGSRTYFDPDVALGCAVPAPEVPAVADVPAEVAAPAVAPAERLDSDELSLFAFVRMNCAPFPASDCVRDAVDPAAVDAPTVPLVPTAPD